MKTHTKSHTSKRTRSIDYDRTSDKESCYDSGGSTADSGHEMDNNNTRTSKNKKANRKKSIVEVTAKKRRKTNKNNMTMREV